MFGRQGKTHAPALPAHTATVDVRPASGAHVGTYFDESSQFTGSLKLNKSVNVDGSIEGDLDCSGTVTIGPSGKVTAHIRAESVLIDGEVHGDIEARSPRWKRSFRRFSRAHIEFPQAHPLQRLGFMTGNSYGTRTRSHQRQRRRART